MTRLTGETTDKEHIKPVKAKKTTHDPKLTIWMLPRTIRTRKQLHQKINVRTIEHSNLHKPQNRDATVWSMHEVILQVEGSYRARSENVPTIRRSFCQLSEPTVAAFCTRSVRLIQHNRLKKTEINPSEPKTDPPWFTVFSQPIVQAKPVRNEGEKTNHHELTSGWSQRTLRSPDRQDCLFCLILALRQARSFCLYSRKAPPSSVLMVGMQLIDS